MKNETWLAVPGYEGLYEISDRGACRRLTFTNRVVNKELTRPRMLRSFKRRKGYPGFALSKEGRSHQFFIHTLVLLAFVGPRPDGYHGAHLDGNFLNNNRENLAWVTPQENMDHKLIHGTQPFGSQLYNSKLTEASVVEIRKRHLSGDSKSFLSREYNVSRRLIRDVIEGKRWAHV